MCWGKAEAGWSALIKGTRKKCKQHNFKVNFPAVKFARWLKPFASITVIAPVVVVVSILFIIYAQLIHNLCTNPFPFHRIILSVLCFAFSRLILFCFRGLFLVCASIYLFFYWRGKKILLLINNNKICTFFQSQIFTLNFFNKIIRNCIKVVPNSDQKLWRI